MEEVGTCSSEAFLVSSGGVILVGEVAVVGLTMKRVESIDIQDEVFGEESTHESGEFLL